MSSTRNKLVVLLVAWENRFNSSTTITPRMLAKAKTDWLKANGWDWTGLRKLVDEITMEVSRAKMLKMREGGKRVSDNLRPLRTTMARKKRRREEGGGR